MKAIVVNKFGDEKELVVQNVDIPKPGKKQSLIKVFASGVNPIDTYFRKGIYGAMNPPLPFIIGKDVSGVVEEVGEDSKWKVGERVFASMQIGAYAQYAVANDNDIYNLPENVSFEQGSAVYVPYFTAYLAMMFCAKTQTSDVLLIHGATGGTGSAAVQIAKRKGIKTIWGTAGSEEGMSMLLKEGCHKVFNHRKEGYVQEIIKEGGCDVILEMLANVNLSNDLQILKKYGRVAVIGNRGEISINPRDLMVKRSTVTGVSLFNTEESEKEEMAKDIVDGLSSGDYTPIVGKTYSLENSFQAHYDIINTTSAQGKLVILPWDK